MVARSYLLSLLAVVATLASNVAALPQEDAPVPPASELESVPVELDTPAADARPVPGAESNTLLDVAPELGRLANEEPNPAARMTKREVINRPSPRPFPHILIYCYQKQCADEAVSCIHFRPTRLRSATPNAARRE
jgi:hypothetical protein